jgi:uracil-DNA glycosylase
MSERRNVVYLLWGSKAQSKADFLNTNDNLVLKAPHPSPLSAHRGFFGCKHFSLANEYLKETGGEVIQW